MRSSPGTERDAPRNPAELSEEELRTELEQTRAWLDETEDHYLRARADLDNYRKRAERDVERRVREQGDALLRGWLEVVDTVERALALGPDDPGLRAVLEQMESLLTRHGVRRFGEAGDMFDPERHEAIAVVADPDRPAGTIAEVARSGYSAGDRVLRPAQVAVARPSADGPADGD
ncbi:MAG: GrpE protein [Actinomycetia bacterium]|jgi:molecular chaperone GrpE|nr:GrpE protein [Actinomycetes bacterium]